MIIRLELLYPFSLGSRFRPIMKRSQTDVLNAAVIDPRLVPKRWPLEVHDVNYSEHDQM